MIPLPWTERQQFLDPLEIKIIVLSLAHIGNAHVNVYLLYIANSCIIYLSTHYYVYVYV